MTVLLIPLVFYALLTSVSGAREEISASYTSSVSGQKVPARIIELFLRKLHSSAQSRVDPESLVYEITDDGFLRGSDLEIDVFRDTRPLNESDLFTYSFNGLAGQRLEGSEIRQGTEVTVLLDGKHHNILNVWGKQLFLTPLSSVKYPGIFINIHPSLRLDNDVVSTQVPSADRGDLAIEKLDESVFNATLRQAGTCASGATHYVEVAVAFDNSFCKLFSNSQEAASAYVQSVINEADVIYRRDTCVSVALVYLEAHCDDPSDPYRSLSSLQGSNTESKGTKILDGFRSIWESSRSNVQRDVAMFFSGFEDETSTAGIAFIAAACGGAGYGWVERGTVSTFVHELGHTLSCSHTSEGVMQESSSSSDPMFFSPHSVTQITEYIDGSPSFSQGSGCIESSKPQCDSKCPGKCVNGQCIRMYSASASPKLVPCTPVEGTYLCTQERTFSEFGGSYTFGVECPAGFDMVQRERADINVFCCMPPSESRTEGIVARENAFVSLNIGGQSIPGYISDPSLITQTVLMKTQLVPSCTTSSNSQSLPSTKPPATRGPSSVQLPTGTPEPPSTVLPSIQPPTTTLPTRGPPTTRPPAQRPPTTRRQPMTGRAPTALARTCADTFRPGQTFICSRRTVLRERLSLLGAQVTLTVEQRYGQFVLIASAIPLRIVEFTGTMSTRAKLREDKLGLKRRFSSIGVSSTSIETDAFEMRVPRGSSKCCRENIYVYARLKVCAWFFGNDCVTTRVLKGVHRMRCARLCQGGRGRVIPFSRRRECPMCRN